MKKKAVLLTLFSSLSLLFAMHQDTLQKARGSSTYPSSISSLQARRALSFAANNGTLVVASGNNELYRIMQVRPFSNKTVTGAVQIVEREHNGVWLIVNSAEEGDKEIIAIPYNTSSGQLGNEQVVHTNSIGSQESASAKRLFSGDTLIGYQSNHTGSKKIYALRYTRSSANAISDIEVSPTSYLGNFVSLSVVPHPSQDQYAFCIDVQKT